MDWNKYKRIAIFRKEDLTPDGYPKGSMKKLEMADIALKEIEAGNYEIIKDRFGWTIGTKLYLNDSMIAKVLLNEEA